MEIKVKNYASLCELEIKSDNAIIKEDLSDCENTLDEDLVSVAHDIACFKGISDLDFVANIVDYLLSKADLEELIERFKKD